ARYAAEQFSSISKIEARAVYSSEFLLEETIAYQDGILYIFITQSGETTDTNSALEKAKEFGVKTLCITNKENSTIWNASEYKIACLAGEEKSIAATKSFISQLLCSTLLALKFAQNKGIDIYDYILDLKSIPSFINSTYDLQPKIKNLARFLSKYKNIIMTADGHSYALAKEASLKIKETSYLNTTSAILGEFMHGHVAVLNNKSTVLTYILNDNMNYTTIKNLDKIKTNYNPPICIIGNRTNQVKSTYNLNIECEKPIVKTFCIAVMIQLLALETALKLHRNVDKPHGLNKVVK
ncbi:MAG: SIS domain-containing protein, partial [Candidatus Gastranaerophilales bacterium]|nr:SIS domain-containing protein [Candidatus Gastranaerophilales bacterium]